MGLMRALSVLFFLCLGLMASPAGAQLAPVDAHYLGFAQPTEMGFGVSASEEMMALTDVALLVMYIMIAICVFVLALLIWVAIRYNRRANPTPSKTTHSTILEVLWTGIPTLIVIFVGFLGVRQIIEFERTPALGMLTAYEVYDGEDVIVDINVYGLTTWAWGYEVTYFGDEATATASPDFYNAELGQGVLAAGLSYTSTMLEHPDYEYRQVVSESEEEAVLATWGQLGRDLDFYQFDVDHRLVIPSGVRVQVNVQGAAGADKQHAWAVPAFAVKRDFWPGRVNSAHFLVPEGHEGLYFGQCSEFCGANHAFMPIAVHVVTLDEYRAYFASQMAAALDAAQSGGLFVPDYLPVNLPAPYGSAGTVAQR